MLACLGAACDTSQPVRLTPPLLVPTVATLNGTVISAQTRTPLAGVRVTAAGQEVTTGATGLYWMHVLDGDVVMTAERQGFATYSDKLSVSGARTVDILMVPSAR